MLELLSLNVQVFEAPRMKDFELLLRKWLVVLFLRLKWLDARRHQSLIRSRLILSLRLREDLRGDVTLALLSFIVIVIIVFFLVLRGCGSNVHILVLKATWKYTLT
jgi:hypothetical protein